MWYICKAKEGSVCAARGLVASPTLWVTQIHMAPQYSNTTSCFTTISMCDNFKYSMIFFNFVVIRVFKIPMKVRMDSKTIQRWVTLWILFQFKENSQFYFKSWQIYYLGEEFYVCCTFCNFLFHVFLTFNMIWNYYFNLFDILEVCM